MDDQGPALRLLQLKPRHESNSIGSSIGLGKWQHTHIWLPGLRKQEGRTLASVRSLYLVFKSSNLNETRLG